MRRAAFADLIGVSRPQVSKYERTGAIVVAGDDVDAAASLALLEGRLDEEKRQRALRTLVEVDGEQPPAPTQATAPAAAPRSSAKAEKDTVELALKRLQYAREAGEVVDAAEVDAAARDAITLMRETFGNRRREIADAVCAQFGLPGDRASALARLLAKEFEASLGAFAGRLALAPDLAATEPRPGGEATAAATATG